MAQRAFEANKAGRYQEAVKLYLRGYELTPLSSILYNVAAIYDRRLKDPALAADFYRRYAAAPDAEPELTKKALARIEQIQQEQRTRVSVPIDDTPREPPKVEVAPVLPKPEKAAPVVTLTERRPGPGRWVAVGLGVAAVVSIGVGAGFGINAMELNRQAGAFCAGAICGDPRGVSLTNEALTSANVANVSIAGGAALGVAALVVGLVSASSDGPSVSLAPVPGGGVLVLGGAL
ncbi:MAG: hypothetical protein ACOZQL_05430 [Myxococcota bacterium]